MNVRDIFPIVSIVVLICWSLLCRPGLAGISQSPLEMVGISSSVDLAEEVNKVKLDNAYRSLFQLNPSENLSNTRQHKAISADSMSLIAHVDSSHWRQRSDTRSFDAGDDAPYSQPKKFLLSVDNAVFSCREDACDNYYRECGLDIDYTVYSEHVTREVSDAAIICRAKIVYQTEGGYHLNSEAGPETSHHTLNHHAHYSSHLSLHFHFSEYEQVIEVRLDKIECRVHPGDYVSRVTESSVE